MQMCHSPPGSEGEDEENLVVEVGSDSDQSDIDGRLAELLARDDAFQASSNRHVLAPKAWRRSVSSVATLHLDATWTLPYSRRLTSPPLA